MTNIDDEDEASQNMVTVRRNEILITEDEENEKDDDAEVQINMKTEESQEAVDFDQEDYTEQ